MSKTLNGAEAIDYAESHGISPSKRADSVEGAREDLTWSEARAIAATEPELIYVEALDA